MRDALRELRDKSKLVRGNIWDVGMSFDIETTQLNTENYHHAYMYIWQYAINDICIYGRTWGAFTAFYNEIVSEYGKVTHAFGDYGALGQVLTYGLNKKLQQSGIPLFVDDCIKGQIIDRIYMDQMLFAQGRRFILRKCKYLIESYQQAVWSDKEPDTRLDDGTTPIDDLDASEYSMFPFYDKLMQNIRGIG